MCVCVEDGYARAPGRHSPITSRGKPLLMVQAIYKGRFLYQLHLHVQGASTLAAAAEEATAAAAAAAAGPTVGGLGQPLLVLRGLCRQLWVLAGFVG